jgi:hypothetical protein
MAVIRDVMPVFELYQPASVDDAIRLLDQHGSDSWVLAGGLDSMDWLKDRLRKPKRWSISVRSPSCVESKRSMAAWRSAR